VVSLVRVDDSSKIGNFVKSYKTESAHLINTKGVYRAVEEDDDDKDAVEIFSNKSEFAVTNPFKR
jgi:hypothetical protein